MNTVEELRYFVRFQRVFRNLLPLARMSTASLESALREIPCSCVMSGLERAGACCGQV